MLEDSQNADEKELLSAVNDTLMQTGNLTQALEDTHAYPDYMISMVRIGEQTGRLQGRHQPLDVFQRNVLTGGNVLHGNVASVAVFGQVQQDPDRIPPLC